MPKNIFVARIEVFGGDMTDLAERLELKDKSKPYFLVVIFGIVSLGLIWAVWREPTPELIAITVLNFLLFLLFFFYARNQRSLIFDVQALTFKGFGITKRFEWTEIHSFKQGPTSGNLWGRSHTVGFIEAGKENQTYKGYTMFVPVYGRKLEDMIATMEAFRERALDLADE